MKKREINNELKDYIKKLIKSSKIYKNEHLALVKSCENNNLSFIGKNFCLPNDTNKGIFIVYNSQYMCNITNLITIYKNKVNSVNKASISNVITKILIRHLSNKHWINNDKHINDLKNIIFSSITDNSNNYICVVPFIGAHINKSINLGKYITIANGDSKSKKRLKLYCIADESGSTEYFNDLNYFFYSNVKAHSRKEAMDKAINMTNTIIAYLLIYIKKSYLSINNYPLSIYNGHRDFASMDMNGATLFKEGDAIYINHKVPFIYRESYINKAIKSNTFSVLLHILVSYSCEYSISNMGMSIIRSLVLTNRSIHENKNDLKYINYMIAIECLLEKDSKNLIKHLSYRISVILGNTKNQQIKYYKSFKKLYTIRSDFVHGDIIPKDKYTDNVFNIFDIYVKILKKIFMNFKLFSSNNKINKYVQVHHLIDIHKL